ncbi:MAG: MFS transporter [Burkholderiales bacterium]|nr:MAG: MFS transporter [Burkholderiales bacterium]
MSWFASLRSGQWGTLLREPDFRRLWYVGIAVYVVRWLEILAVGVFTYQKTGSAFLVAMLTMLRMLPLGLFGAFFGAVADRVERRGALIFIVAASLAVSVVLAVIAVSGHLEVWHLAVASFIGGVGWATDNPVRRVMIGQVAGPDRMSGAMSLDVGTNNASRMTGPMVGGALLALTGIAGAFALCAVLYLFGLVAAMRVRHQDSGAPALAAPVLAGVMESIAVARRDPRLLGTLLITLIFNLFGWPFTSMVPVIGQDRLGLAAEGIGVLASMDGVGSLLGAMAVGVLARPSNYRLLYVGGVAGFLVMMPVFALSTSAVLGGGALLFSGFAQAGFSIMQATIIYVASPPQMRSRMLGLLTVCIGVAPVGFAHVGLLADAIGAHRAGPLMAFEGLVALALTWRWWRAI